MSSLHKRYSDRWRVPSDEAQTLTPCPRCHGNGMIVIDDNGITYRTKMCRWCEGSGGINHDVMGGWNRLQRWIRFFSAQNIPFRL